MRNGSRLGATVLGVSAFLALALSSPMARARGCHEVSDIVGYEHCTRFGGQWAVDGLPRIFVGLELIHSEMALRGRSVDAYVTSGTSTATFDGSALGVRSFSTTGGKVRIGGYLFGPLYAGVGLGVGLGTNRFESFQVNRTLLTSSGGINTGGEVWSGLLGVRVPLGRLSLRVEGDVSWVPFCVSGANGGVCLTPGVLEPRAALDVWATPHLTMSLFGGIDALHPNEPSTLGISMEFHTRSFDGAFALW